MIKSDKIKPSSRRGRPPVPDYIRNAIVALNQSHPGWSANKILIELHRVLFSNFKEKHPDWTKDKIEAQIKLPSANTVNRNILPKEPPDECLAREWQLSLAGKYKQITPKALFYISEVQHYCELAKENPDPPFGKYPSITVRQALWIGKLYTFVPYFVAQWRIDKKIHKWQLKTWCAISLYRWSKAYADYEELCSSAHTTFDTSKLDKGLRNGAIPLIVKEILIEGVPITKDGAVMLLYAKDQKLEMLSPDEELLNKISN